MRDVINGVIANRTEARGKLDALLDKAKAEKRGLSDDEKTEFDKLEAEVRAFDARIDELDAQIRADEKASEVAKRYAASGVQVTSEPEVYRKGIEGRSYFKDLYNARANADRDAIERLVRNDRMRTDAEKRAISTTNGAGGEFVPPLWLESEFIKLARPGRITANLTPTFDLPAGTDSLNIPKVATGTAVAQQASQNSAVQQTDLTTTSVSSPVVTIAGGQTISLQLLQQSPLNIDEIILQDLAAAYAVALNGQVLAGAGGAGNLTGITTLAGTNAVSFTGSTLAALYSKLAGAIQAIHTARYMPPDVIVMHPRRWAWAVAQADSNGRPLVLPGAGSPMNTMGQSGEVVSQGFVGTMLGLPVYVDATIATNQGAGTNQDYIIVARMADLMLWESTVRAEAFNQTFAQNLSVFVRLYNYASFQAGRYPQSIAIVSGTGLVTPTF